MNGVDLRLVEYFVAVIDHGGVTKAAQAMYVAQPSMSQAIKSLERQVGTALFQRVGRNLELTDAGREFERSARKVMRDVAAARDRVSAVRELRAGRLLLSAIAELTLDPLPALVYEFRQKYPDIEVHVTDPGDSAGVAAEVRGGSAEIGLATLPTRTDALDSHPIARHQMVLAMQRQYAAELPDPVPRGLLRTLPIIRGADDRFGSDHDDQDLLPSTTEVTINSAFRQANWELVMAGAGIGFMPEPIAQSQLTGVEIRTIDPPIHRDVVVLFQADQLSEAAAAFLAVLGASHTR